VKPFQSGAFCLSVPKVAAVPAAPAWLGRSIATQKLRILEHSAFVDQQRDQDTYHNHLFVHIGGNVDYSDPLLEVSCNF
jgi:transcriptional enhancer factor